MQNKTARLEIRLSSSEKQIVEKRAKEAGLTISEYIRHRIVIDAPPKAKPA